MPNIPENVLSRIKKCLALAAGNASEGEAANALRQARKLMEKYGVTNRDIELSEIVERVYEVKTNLFSYWQQELANVVCRIFGVQFLTRHRTSSKRGYIVFVGAESGAELAEYLFTVLQRQLRHDRSEYRKRLNESPSIQELRSFCRFRGISWAKTKAARGLTTQVEAFSTAWVAKVEERCVEMFVPQPDTLTLYLSDRYAGIERTDVKTVSSRDLQRYERAVRDGYAKGAEAQIHVGVRADGNPLAIGGEE